jgi:FAD/FMN-containing dehydrogenase
LDAIGFSPAVMQSNNDFGVAGTFSVNAHGWPVPFGPFGSTVRSLTVMLADGAVLECSRNRNPEIFSMAMGGYGLTGIVTELHMDMVPNIRLEPEFELMPSREFGTNFLAAAMQGPAVQMAYGRMNVAINEFLEEAVMVTYRQSEDQSDLPGASRSAFVDAVSREILRGQVGSERMKNLRWTLETGIAPIVTGGSVTRNALLDEPVSVLRDNNSGRTDILHEYFVPPARFADFIAACQEIIPSSYQELLNVTLRYVGSDGDSVLTYAPRPRIAAVMLFSQERNLRGEADMVRMTGALIEAVLGMGGTYYLPYRPHATVDQFARGYPGLPEFISRKRALDPGLVFRNGFWDRYMVGF